MDHIELTIEQEGVDSGALFIGVKINDIDLPGILNVQAFFAIKQENELVPLFICGCGDFGCGGYYVNVAYTDTALILRNGHHRYIYSLPTEFEYQLEWQQVRSIAREIITYLEKIQVRNPKAYVTTGYGGENLIDHLTDFRKSFLLVPR